MPSKTQHLVLSKARNWNTQQKRRHRIRVTSAELTRDGKGISKKADVGWSGYL